MKIGGQWVGLGPGDSSEDVRRVRSVLRAKFSYAKHLDDTTVYDEALVGVVAEAQRRYERAGKLKPGSYLPGVVNWATRVALGMVTPPPPRDDRPMLFTVCGTGVPWWVGPDADAARAVESRYRWQPTGYPARPFPMGPSIRAGKDELENQINRHRQQIERCGMALLGYSQGAIVATELFSEQIRPIGGRLRWAYQHLTKACMWGNPCRERGKVWPDLGGPPSPHAHGGVTPNLLTETPSWWREYAHRGDLYTDVPPDESGENRTAIWQLIRDGDPLRGPDSLLRQFLELGGVVKDAHQIVEATGMVKAMLDALVFFGQGTKPHVNYSTAEAVAYLVSPS